MALLDQDLSEKIIRGGVVVSTFTEIQQVLLELGCVYARVGTPLGEVGVGEFVGAEADVQCLLTVFDFS
ncbi:hypothetical protein FRC0024_02436 [Corynebacterium diphtheriae]|nr:hypothetical protein FRC0024_02436 [Corynebacterium diphtheriae]